jgi:hypothetical protein
MWRNETCVQNFGRINRKGRDNLGDLDVDSHIIVTYEGFA